MKRNILVVILFALAFSNSIYAVNCKMVALHDTFAVESPTDVMKQGTTFSDVTEYVVKHNNGDKSYCIHGGYCYLAFVRVGGRLVEALKLTNCRVDLSSGSNEGDEDIYSLGPISARAPAPPTASESVTDIKGVSGSCQNGSQTVSGPEQEDVKGREIAFYCDFAAISFLDNVNKRLIIRFFDSKHIKDGGRLGFSGEMKGDGKTLTVEQLEFIDPKKSAALAGKESFCELVFSGTSLRGIQCFAFIQAGGYKNLALINFVADPGQ